MDTDTVLSLEFGKKVYDWMGRHPRVYRFIRWISCLCREAVLQKHVVQAIGLKNGDTVLDLGCGNGVNFSQLQKAIGSTGKIIAFDYSERMLTSAKAFSTKQGWQNIQFVQGDAARLELPENSLDGAVCTFVLSAMPGEDAAIHHVATALNPGCRFVVFDAKPFIGVGRVLNPIVCPIFKYTTNWNYEKDVIGTLRRFFADIVVKEFNSGGNFIAVATKKSDL